tara:strand:- start:132 stop:1523 length:1392 start_codon:yes stop_codon:yes gene_type:complete
MIERYSRAEMVKIWEPANKFKIWFEIEAHACDALAKQGVIPKKAAQAIWEKGNKEYTLERIRRIEAIEEETRHDVIAFLTELAEHIGDEARYVHKGMTSSDVLDTCMALQMKQSSDLILANINTLMCILRKRAEETKLTPIMGRSHGIHAEPLTMGLKFARYYKEFSRNQKRLLIAKDEISTCAISGAVGTFSSIDPKVEDYVASKLGLAPEPISTQIIPRDRHAYFFATLGVIASSIENLATEIRHMQRTEVREVQEYFSPNQKGSSAMPHKRNPVLSENLTGLARLVRAAVIPALENVALWHERDISHSAVERVIAPDTLITLDFALVRLSKILEGLIILPNNMLTNLNAFRGIHDTHRVLLYLVEKGVSREKAYKIVQRNAMKVWESIEAGDVYKGHIDAPFEREGGSTANKNCLIYFLTQDEELTALVTVSELESLLNKESLSYYIKWVDFIFQRVFPK